MSAYFNTGRNLIEPETTVFWFRRDLRLEDNAALFYALKERKNVLSVFIFDTNILDRLEDNGDARVEFIHYSIGKLKEQLERWGSSLLILHGDPVQLFADFTPAAVYANHDYEPYARLRDNAIAQKLSRKGLVFKTFKDTVVFEKSEITKDNNEPYTVFTPYSKKWRSRLTDLDIKPFRPEKYLDNLKQIPPLPFPSLREIGFHKPDMRGNTVPINYSAIDKYDTQRDFPALEGTSRISVHLRFGIISIRKLVKIALQKNTVWLNELIWREFYHMILWHFPHVETEAFKPAYNRIAWRNNPEEFEAWCNGRTGYPLVDAGMRELNATGYMHNRARMVTASFLAKHLLVDWRWGEAYFAKKLLDYDLAANNGGWQWCAGSGCDAAPYFRIFNPALQAKRFDPALLYIKKWVPELGKAYYPKPLVDHEFARNRCLQTYRKALDKTQILF